MDPESKRVMAKNQKMLADISREQGFHAFHPKEYKLDSIKDITIVAPEDRITSDIMTVAEYCEVVGNRAKHIENSKNFIVFTNVEGETDPIKMAKKEIKDKRCPLSIIRMYGDRIGEVWEVNELVTKF